MPLYSFLCTTEDCATQFDVLLPSYKSPMPRCPECDSAVKRIITSAPAVSLKGTGWSKDNYSCTDMGAESESVRADRKGKIVSYVGQKNKGRA